MRVNIKASNKYINEKTFKENSLVKELKSFTHRESDTWIDNNINSLNDVKELLKLLLYNINNDEEDLVIETNKREIV